MGDYGFRISQEEKDVKDCTDLETVVTSKYPLLKGGSSGTGSIELDPNKPDEMTVTINHNLGYIPYAQCFCAWFDYDEFPVFDFVTEVYSFGADYSLDSNNLYLNFMWYDWEVGDIITVDYAWFIYNEQINI